MSTMYCQCLKVVYSAAIIVSLLGIGEASTATLVPPKLIPLSRSAQLRRGERYHVTCSTSDGSPPLTFTWSRDGEAVEGGKDGSPSEAAVRRLDDFSSSLVVEDVQEQHTGNYSCTVANAAGRDTATTSLQVLFPPIWVRPPSDASVVAGSKINLYCEAKGSPKPTITWRKNTDFSAMDFDVIHSDGRLRISEDGQSIKIPEAKKEDEGFFECHVTNGIGDPLRKSIRVEVQVPPKVASGPSSLVVEKNKDVNIQCNMTGDSPLNIMWEKNGRPLEPRKPKVQIQEFPTDKGVTTSLMLLHVDRASSGLYVCKAKNSYGESHRSINVDVVEIPGQPKEVMVSQIWSQSLQVSWTSPYHGNRPIMAYIIHYWKTEGKSEPPPGKPHILRIASLQTVAVVPKLLPNSFYSLYVMAENEVGVGPPSETVSATTREEEPDWAPTELTVLDKHATSCKLRWKCPVRNNWNAPLKGYYVGYKRLSSKTAYTFRSVPATKGLVCKDHQEFVLQGLQRASSYSVVVKAYNHVGTGPASDQVVVHTADGGPPRTPHVKVIQTGGVTCNLKIWPRENSRSLPTAFAIHVREQNGDRHKIYVSVLPSQNYSIGGLSPGRQYEIYVTAHNRFGESAASATIKIITDQTDPSLMEPNAEPVYEKMYFVLPIVLSAIAILIMPIIACYCHNKLNPRPIATELIEDRDFLYAAATLHRLDQTLRRASATMQRQTPARTSSLPRPGRSSRATTTTLPKPEPQPVPEPEPSPALPTSYSTLQNYGTSAIAENEPSPPPVNKATISVPDDGRYDCVVEEMRTFIKDKGSTKPKAVEAEIVMEDDSSDDS